MTYINGSYFTNDSFVFFGPIDMFRDGRVPDDSTVVKCLVSVILVMFMALSSVGNVCVCVVISRNKSMRTPTNLYLINLAVSDFIVGLFVPIEIYFFWIPDFYPFGAVGCRAHYILWDCLSNSSVLTIAAFTVERYLVVTRPFLRQRLTMKSRVMKILAVIWVVSCVGCVPSVLNVDCLETNKKVYCYWMVTESVKVFIVIDIILFFVIPMTIIVVLYVLIALKLKDTHCERRTSPIYGRQDRERTVKMLAAVAGLFFVCWAPFSYYRYMTVTPKFKNYEYYSLWRVMYYLCSLCCYASTAGNPILYSLMSQKFRRAFKGILKGSSESNTRARTEVSLLYTTHGRTASVDAVPHKNHTKT
ncbi:7 transmembrane receptor (rhodopsin family) domain-containing protein [Phthorimaea operculella]|nr:7 transmembrane receptor (rhodopsin family) domain-containing protein [Phthorimaea operculella]